MVTTDDSAAQSAAAYREGRSAGLAIAALSMAAVAWINLVFVEKSLLAIVLAWLALSHAAAGPTRVRARWALGIAITHVLVISGVLIVYHDKLIQAFVALWVKYG